MEKRVTEKKATPLTEEQLLAKEAELNSLAETLAQEKKDFETEKEEFKNHVDSETQKLSEGFADLKEKQKEFSEASKNASEKTKKIIIPADPLKFTFDNDEYQFHEDAPELILFDGIGWTHQEIVENENVLLQIIGGGLGLIIKI